jgi:hypothetical protein
VTSHCLIPPYCSQCITIIHTLSETTQSHFTHYSFICVVMVNKWQVFILKQFQKSKAIIFELLYYGIPYMYGYLVSTVRFITSLNIWIFYATYNLVSNKFYNDTASAFLLYILILYNISMFRFIDHIHLCTVLIWHIRHVRTEHESAFPGNPPFTRWKFVLCIIQRM